MQVYFDNSSTTFPKAPGVAKGVARYLSKGAYNISRGGYQSSTEIGLQVLDVRVKLADFFNAPLPQNVIFTQSITHSLNMILKGYLKRGDHVITTSMEHNAVMRNLTQIGVDYALADNVAQMEDLSTEKTKCIVMIHGSNVSGDVFDLEKAKRIAQRKGLYLIVDCAQTAGVLPIDFNGIDALAFTGHKGLLALPGIGGFIVSEAFNKVLTTTIVGGTGSHSDSIEQPLLMPDKYEAGTANIPGILSLGVALDYINTTGITAIHAKEYQLMRRFIDGLQPFIKSGAIRVVAKGPIETRLAVVSVDFIGRDNGTVAHQLDSRYGIMTRSGLHCSPMAHRSLGTFPQGTVRFSLGYQNNHEQVDYVIKRIEELLHES